MGRLSKTLLFVLFGAVPGAIAPIAADGVLEPGIPLIQESVLIFVALLIATLAFARPQSLKMAVALFVVACVAYAVAFVLILGLMLGSAGSDVVTPTPSAVVGPLVSDTEGVFLRPR